MIFTYIFVFSLIFGAIQGDEPNPQKDEEIQKQSTEDEKVSNDDIPVKQMITEHDISLKKDIMANMKELGNSKPEDKMPQDLDPKKLTSSKTKGERKVERRARSDIDEDIRRLQIIQKEIKKLYSETSKKMREIKKGMNKNQREMLEIYQEQYKIANDFALKKVKECLEKLKKIKNGGGSWSEDGSYLSGGIDETVNPALMNLIHQYDQMWEYAEYA